MKKEKVLLVHLNSNGDCLYSTVIARQIKEKDHPDCDLTWAVSNYCRQSVEGNPYVDHIWEIKTNSLLATEAEWKEVTKQAEAKKKAGEFDVIYYTQIIGNNLVNIDGVIRSSIYNNYPFPITVPKTPIIRLNEKEVEGVAAFAQQHQLDQFNHVILMECGPDSFRSALNPQSAAAFATAFTERHPGTAFILSSNKKIPLTSASIIDGSELSFRQNAELTKYCTHFIGCSSGISWLTTTDWAKPLPKIIITNRSKNFTYSMVVDHEYAGLPTDHIIEFQESPQALEQLTACLHTVLETGWDIARAAYHKPHRVKAYKSMYILGRMSFMQKNYTMPLEAFRRSVKRKGFSAMELVYLLKAYMKLPVYLFKKKKA